MKTIITVKTGKGEMSTSEDVERTEREVMRLAEMVGGNLVISKNLPDGVRVMLTN